jgi:mRNA interferase RelE/StbE
MAYEIRVAPAAERAIVRLAAPVQRAVLVALERLAEDPRPAGCEKMRALDRYDVYRIKVAKDYRIIYQVRDEEAWVLVVKAAHRKEIYRRLDDLRRLLGG